MEMNFKTKTVDESIASLKGLLDGLDAGLFTGYLNNKIEDELMCLQIGLDGLHYLIPFTTASDLTVLMTMISRVEFRIQEMQKLMEVEGNGITIQ